MGLLCEKTVLWESPKEREGGGLWNNLAQSIEAVKEMKGKKNDLRCAVGIYFLFDRGGGRKKKTEALLEESNHFRLRLPTKKREISLGSREASTKCTIK